MATMVMALSSSFPCKTLNPNPPFCNTLFKSSITMHTKTLNPKPILSATTKPLGKSEQPFDKSEKPQIRKKTRPMKMVKSLSTRKFLFSIHRELSLSSPLKSQTPTRKKIGLRHNRRFFIRSRKQIHYKKVRVIGRFIGYQGKIIPRRVTKLTMRHQRLMTDAIKKARILAFLPFCENEKHFKRVRWRQMLNRSGKKRFRKNRRRNESQNRPFGSMLV